MSIPFLHGQVPDWLYERLPWAYLGLGGGLLATMPSMYGRVSGGALVAAGGLALIWRKRYRAKAMLDDLARLSRPVKRPLRQAAWRAARHRMALPIVGHPEQQRAHMRMAAGLVNLEVAMSFDDPESALNELMHQIVADLEDHMAWEADTHKRIGWPLSDAWAREQHGLLHSAQSLLPEDGQPTAQRAQLLLDQVRRIHLSADHPALPSLEEGLLALRTGRTERVDSMPRPPKSLSAPG